MSAPARTEPERRRSRIGARARPPDVSAPNSPAIAEALVGVAPGLTPATVGYVPFFISTALMGVPAIALILLVMAHRKKIETKTTA
ncbi:MAG: hypothetical protein Q7V31_01175 [Parvibaculum sp.]|uniref:hypothetical protein n=1 Tax=Parvibaculum sp. TaxID=2024848 RepID=UPI00271AAD78|nr:hypothetical protein [Parvibaculum sp.]MDO8837510.1 hypothetical protein [Parvibaculum sp.]